MGTVEQCPAQGLRECHCLLFGISGMTTVELKQAGMKMKIQTWPWLIRAQAPALYSTGSSESRRSYFKDLQIPPSSGDERSVDRILWWCE